MMKTHCKRGHKYTPKNTIWNQQSNGKRTRKCRTCANNLHRNGSRRNEKAKRQHRLAERRQLMRHVDMERMFFDPMAKRGDGEQPA